MMAKYINLSRIFFSFVIITLCVACSNSKKSELKNIVESANSQYPQDYEIMTMDSIIYDESSNNVCYYAQIKSADINFEYLKENILVGKMAIGNGLKNADEKTLNFFNLIIENEANIKYIYTNIEKNDSFDFIISNSEIIEMLNSPNCDNDTIIIQ